MQRETRSRALLRHSFHYPVELVSLKWTSSPRCSCARCQFITDHLTSLKWKAWCKAEKKKLETEKNQNKNYKDFGETACRKRCLYTNLSSLQDACVPGTGNNKHLGLCTTLCPCPGLQGAVHTPGAVQTEVTFLGKSFPKTPYRVTFLPPRTPQTRVQIQPWGAAAGGGCLPTLLPRPCTNTRHGSLGLSSSSQRWWAWVLIYSWVLGSELGKSRSAWMKEDKKALRDLLQVKEEHKSCTLPDKRQQPGNYQRAGGALRNPQDMDQCDCRKHRGGGQWRGTTMPAREIKSPSPLTQTGVRKSLLLKLEGKVPWGEVLVDGWGW